MAQKSSTYDWKSDKWLRSASGNFVAFMLILGSSGYLMKNIVENKMNVNKNYDVYKPATEIQNNYQASECITPEKLQKMKFYNNTCKYFQIEDSVKEKRESFNPVLYPLQKLCQKKQIPLYVYKIDLREFSELQDFHPALVKLGVQTYEQLAELDYILENQDELRLQISKEQAFDFDAIAYKFLQNPFQINNLDELYEALDQNAGLPIKYFATYNPQKVKMKEASIQLKIFRKFFYENSNFLGNQAVFMEITNGEVARQLELFHPGQIICVQNKNPYGQFQNGSELKVFNLKLERKECLNLNSFNLEKEFIEVTKKMSPKDFKENFIGKEKKDMLFERFSKFIENIMYEESIVFSYDPKTLKYAKRHLQKRFRDILFVYFNRLPALEEEPVEAGTLTNRELRRLKEKREKEHENTISALQVKNIQVAQILEQLHEIKRAHPDLAVIVSDAKISFDCFNVLQDPKQEQDFLARFISFNRLFSEKSGTIFKMQDIANDSKVEKQFYAEEQDSYILKYRFEFPEGEVPTLSNASRLVAHFVEDVLKAKPTKAKPYLENDLNLAEEMEGVKTLNSKNLQKELKDFPRSIRYCLLEVFSQSCQACKRVEPLLPGLRKRLVEQGIEVARIDVRNEHKTLKEVEKTPTFLLVDVRKSQLLDIEFTPELDDQDGDRLEQLVLQILRDHKFN